MSKVFDWPVRLGALMAERQDRNLGPTKFESEAADVLTIMEGKLAPPLKFYSNPLFRNTFELMCPLGKAILLCQNSKLIKINLIFSEVNISQ